MKRAMGVLFVGFYGAAVVMAACSSSSSSSGSGAVSSIDPSKQAGSLSDAEKTQYCKDVIAYSKAHTSEADSKKLACFSQAQLSLYAGGSVPKSDADLQAKCKSAYTDCLAKPVATADAGASQGGDCSTASKDLANCTATIGELNTCMQDTLAATNAAYATFDTACDKIQLDGGGLDKSSFQQPASCKALASKCPAFAATDDPPTPGK